MLRRAPRSSDVRGVWIFTSGKVTCVSTAESTLLNVSEFGGKPAPAFLTVVAGGGCGRPDPRAVPPTDRHVPQPGQPPGARASPSLRNPGRQNETKHQKDGRAGVHGLGPPPRRKPAAYRGPPTMPAPPATTEKRALRTAPAPRVTRSASAAPARRNRVRGTPARARGMRAGPGGRGPDPVAGILFSRPRSGKEGG